MAQALLAGAVAAGVVVAVGASAAAAVVAVAAALLTCAVATSLFLRRRPFVVTAADVVTHVRVTLLAVIAALLAAAALPATDRQVGSALVVVVAALALASVVLDGVDGRVARARGEDSAAGGRFDIAVDCALAAVLSLAVAGRLGWWVLLIGALPYLFGVAGRVWPWLRAPLPPRTSRKVIGVLPPLVLAAALLPAVPPTAASVMIGAVLALVLASFGRDVLLLRGGPVRAAAAAPPGPKPGARRS